MGTPEQRTRLALLGAVLFCLAMLGLYVVATRSPAHVAPAVPERSPKTEPAARTAARKAPSPAPSLTPPLSRDDLVDAIEASAEDEEETPEDPLGPASFEIVVTDQDGQPMIHVPVEMKRVGRGRARRLATDRSGRVSARVEAGEYVFVATRADGALTVMSDPVQVDASDGGSWDVELIIDSEPTGGLGVGIAQHEEGVLVTYVHPGTPAEEQGLVKGDVVISVEGEPAGEMGMRDFVAAMTGPVGTKVLFEVLHEDGETEILQIERAFIDRPGRSN